MRPDNRTALLAGARRCLDRRGYARTTARDIAGESGVSLAAIGYHFGTTDALLVDALVGGLEEWSADLGSRLGSLPDGGDRLGESWGAVVASLEGYRGVLAASYELIARADDSPEVGTRLRTLVEEARRGLAAQLGDLAAGDDPERERRVGVTAYAVLSGLIVQWLVDPEALPDGPDLAAGLRDLVGRPASTAIS